MYPWLPLTVREVPPNEDRLDDEPFDADREPLIELLIELLLVEALDPKCEPEVEEPPKWEPSMFDTPRFGEIELRVAPSMLLRPEVAEPLLRFPDREFDANEDVFEPGRAFDAALDPRAPPAVDELPANEWKPPAADELPEFTPACVPAVFPVLGPRALPVLPANECQLPSAFARVAPRPAGQPDVRAFKEFERPALDAAPPFRAFIDELPPTRPLFIPFERAPPYAPFERPPPYAPLERPPPYAPPPYPRDA